MTHGVGATGRSARQGSEVLAALLGGVWLVLLGLVLGGEAGFLVSELAPPSYQAKTSLLVTPVSQSPPGETRLSNYTRAYSGLATVSEVVGEAASESGVDPEEIQQHITVESSPDSPLFRVTASSDDPERAVTMANSVGSAVASFTEGLSEDSGYRAEVIAEAAPPEDPSWPNTPLNVAAGATTGLLVGGAAALALSGRSRRAGRTEKEPDRKPRAAVDTLEQDGGPVGGSEPLEDSLTAPTRADVYETASSDPVAPERNPESPPAVVGEAATEEPLEEDTEGPPERATEDGPGDGYNPWSWRLRRAGFAAESRHIDGAAGRGRGGGGTGRGLPGERG